MPASVLLYGVLVGLAIAMLVVALAPARSRGGGIATATAVIEERYAQRAGTDEEAQVPTLPPWLSGIGQRLSPAGTVARLQRRLDIAGNPERWNTDRLFAVKAVGLLGLGRPWPAVRAARPHGGDPGRRDRRQLPGSSCPTCC